VQQKFCRDIEQLEEEGRKKKNQEKAISFLENDSEKIF